MNSSTSVEKLTQDTEAQKHAADAEPNRGRSADTSIHDLLGSREEIAVRTYREANNTIVLIARGITYALLLALLPALAISIAIYGLLLGPAQAEQRSTSLPRPCRRA